MKTVIRRSALVAYTPHQMFELVNAIAEYPRFLPWCSATEIFSSSEREVKAAIEVAWSGMHKSFTTRNTLDPDASIRIELVSGPFKHLTGCWTFAALGETGCRISLELEFELMGQLVDRIFQPVFHPIANSLVDAFCRRAVEVYGN